MNLYTSDLHFGHKNVIQFDHRPFSNVEEMDAFIMQRSLRTVSMKEYV